MRIVIVNPKIWKVNVIGIGTPPLQRIPGKTARRCFGALGVQKEPYLFYQTGRKMSINGVCCAIGKRKAWHSIQQEGAAGKRSAPSGDLRCAAGTACVCSAFVLQEVPHIEYLRRENVGKLHKLRDEAAAAVIKMIALQIEMEPEETEADRKKIN